LKHNPDFDKFKYPLAHMIKCGGGTSEFYPKDFKERVVNHFKNNKFNTLNDIGLARKPAASAPVSFNDLEKLVKEDTEKNHGSTNLYKYNKHEKFLKGYLQSVEKLPLEVAEKDAKYFSEKVVTPEQNTFHAISDPGGVAGVAEASTKEISKMRILLEPFNVDISHWSLVHGKDNAYNSFSFSDQFVQFEQQKLFDDILKEAGSCAELEKRIPASLSGKVEVKKDAKAPSSELIESIEGICAAVGSEESMPIPMDKLKGIFAPAVALAKPKMQKTLQKCLTCHEAGSGLTEFKGLEKFVKSSPTDVSPSSYSELTEYLNSFSMNPKLTNAEMFQYKLGVHSVNPYGMDMPPSDWSDNKEYAQENGIDPINVQNIRRKELALWLTMAASQGDKETLKHLCRELNGDGNQKDAVAPTSDKRENTKAKQE
jgi:hypothetical protein